MALDADLDEVDFRPFFDMVVGIIFILLILVGALLLLQQNDAADRAARESAHVVEAEVGAFLRMLRDDLERDGFAPRLDLEKRAIYLPLGPFATVGPDGLPQLSDERIDGLGRILARDLACLETRPEPAEFCAPFDRLRLGLASLDIRAGDPPEGARLPQEQFARLLRNEFAAALLRGSPALLALFDPAGGSAFDVTERLSAAVAAQGGGVGGDVAIALAFATK